MSRKRNRGKGGSIKNQMQGADASGDGDPEIENPRPTPGDNPRNAAMEAIAQGRNAVFNAEQEASGSDDLLDNVPEVGDSEGTADVLPEVQVVEEVVDAGVTQPPATPEAPKGRLVSIEMEDGAVIQVPASSVRSTIKVEGVESEISLEELTNTHQKSELTSKRLAEVTKMQRELQEQPPSQKGVVPSAPPADTGVQDQAGAVIDALFNGDIEQAKVAFAGVLAQKPTATNNISKDDLASDVVRTLEIRSAWKQFAEDFKGIHEDELLMSKTDQFADEIMLENPDTIISDLFTEAGKRTQAWLADLTGTPVAPAAVEKQATPKAVTAPGMDTRREQKSKTVRSIPTSASQVSSLGEEPKVPTHSDTIAEMKAARGQ